MHFDKYFVFLLQFDKRFWVTDPNEMAVLEFDTRYEHN